MTNSRRQTIKAEQGWAIWVEHLGFIDGCISYTTRNRAIELFLNEEGKWKDFYHDGYRCIPVDTTPRATARAKAVKVKR